jgi:hypothetical protein
MPQLHLPMFPTGVTHITSELAFEKRDGCITYFNGHMPVFTHGEKDVATFRMDVARCSLRTAASGGRLFLKRQFAGDVGHAGIGRRSFRQAFPRQPCLPFQTRG